MKRKIKKMISLVLSLTILMVLLFPIESDALTSADLSISDNGIAFICAREGFHSTCYKDNTQSSIGYGTKCTGSSVQPHASGSHSITRERAMAEMKSQINASYAPRVRNQTSGITMNQNQFDALVSLCYNTGGGTTIISNSPLVKYLRGSYSETQARSEYSSYFVKSGGAVLQGLINRRNAEADLFFSGSTPDPVSFEVDERYPTPITAYPAATSGKITVYSQSLTAYSQSTRYIAWDDLCTINAVYTNGYCSVTYPTSNGSHTEYAKVSDFIPNGVTPFSWSPSSNVTAYVRSDMSTSFGAVFASDSCKVVGKVGDTKLQVIYPVSGGYKLGWVVDNIPPVPSDFPTPMIGYIASSDTRATVYESLSTMGIYYGQIFVDDRCTLNTVSVSGGWIYVTYPVGNSTKSGYVYLSDFVPTASKLTTFYTTTVTQQSDTFRKPDMATNYGWVSAGDQITVVGKSGNKLQVLYPVDDQYGGGYKIAWMYDTYVVKNLTGISIETNPIKTEYLEGENLNTNGLKVNAHYDDGSTANVTGSCSFSGYSSSPGVKTVTVSYSGKQTAFTVKVNSKSPTSLAIKTLPNKTTYEIGEEINTTGLTGQVSFDNGTSEDLSDFDILYDDNITSTAGNKTISVNYFYNNKSVSTSFYVTVLEAELTSPTNPTNPTTPTNPLNPEDAAFVVSRISEKSGATVNVDVSIQNNPGITALKISLSYPTDELTLKNVEYKSLFSSHATGSNKMNSPFTISWFSNSSSNESANGVLATLTFEIANDAADGTYPVELSYDPDDVFNSQFDNVEFAISNGAVIVANSIPGDTNGDKKVNMKDIVFLQQYLNGWNVTIDTKAADVNGDGKVNMKDIVFLQQYMNGWNVVLK